MLEIKNLTKIYNTRGGVSVKALDDVSITFAETGLVFLLGKSGSGKSTLLNVAGGLDEPTSGEVIVKGKSSKSFTGSDFDSYRNTFVGFVFQEYNVLDEFNVEDNVALALELQGKPKDGARIEAILRDVELESFAKRRPNTLSGGQKQRIAIARALVKDPQIIMADEPTGALDSATGRQVFDVLKKLSETRLVIVVSHDREFAEIYGDRIVELKDGKIISDETKTHVPPEKIDENLHIIGGNTLSIKSGATLTQENFAQIQSFIKNADGDVVITRGKREIAGFKKANRLSDGGAAEKFESTQEIIPQEYSPEQSAFIRSKLPAVKALRIGASGLKLKPVRLVFTVFLAVIAFIMFGLSSTMMMYDGNGVMVSSFVNAGVEQLDITKSGEVRVTNKSSDYDYTTYFKQKFSDGEVEAYRGQYGNDAFGYRATVAYMKNVTLDVKKAGYYFGQINYFGVLDKDSSLLNKITGSYPVNDDEICVSSYTYEVIKNGEFSAVSIEKDGSGKITGDKIEIKSKEDLIGKYLLTDKSVQPMKITGVFESGKIPEQYDELLTAKTEDYRLRSKFNAYLSERLHLTAFVTSDFLTQFDAMFADLNLKPLPNAFKELAAGSMYNIGHVETDEDGKQSVTIFYGGSLLEEFGCDRQLKTYMLGGRTAIADDEVVLSLSVLDSERFLYGVREYYADGDKFAEFEKNLSVYLNGYYVADLGDGYTKTVYCSKAQRRQAREWIGAEISKTSPKTVTLFMGLDNTFEMKVVGFYYYDELEYSEIKEDGAYFTAKFIKDGIAPVGFVERTDDLVYDTDYIESDAEIYDGVILPYNGTAGVIRSVLAFIGEEHKTDNDAVFGINSSVYESVESANMMIDVLSLMFLIIGLVLAIFAALLLFNFISVSIANKRKEIGILRALGARGLDVFKIFFAESGIIVGICTALALIGTAVLCSVLNGVIMRDLGLMVTLFVFGAGPIAVLCGVALAVALISTFLPVFFAARKKPVDSIRAL